MESAVVLLSGGLDSSVLLHYVVKQLRHSPVYALSVEYGQKHRRELEMAGWQAAALPQVREHCVVDLRALLPVYAGASALLRDGAPVPDLDRVAATERDQPPTYVPNRNMVLLAVAAACAESRSCPVVFYGAQAQDEYGYWDCTAEFVHRINAVLALNRRLPVRVEAPFAGRRKADGVRLGIQLGVDFARTWSCYRGGARPCGRCPTCVERANAFAEAGVPDPGTAATAGESR
jgi:7-cyano-7-deazaguanine synthase